MSGNLFLESRSRAHYGGGVGTTEFAPGDVIYVPQGPFSGVCGVVREVNVARSELRVEVAFSEQRHGLTVRFDEVEWA